jgi:hypothetical protein
MTTRVLDRAEWADALSETDLALALPFFPEGVRVIVCEQAGAIVGHIALVPMWHIEGVYVDPAHRGGGRVFAALVTAMHAEARALAQRTVFPAAADDRMAQMVTQLGAVEIPARWFALKVRES